MGSNENHLRVILQETNQSSKLSFKIMYLKFHSNLLRTNKVKTIHTAGATTSELQKCCQRLYYTEPHVLVSGYQILSGYIWTVFEQHPRYSQQINLNLHSVRDLLHLHCNAPLCNASHAAFWYYIFPGILFLIWKCMFVNVQQQVVVVCIIYPLLLIGLS